MARRTKDNVWDKFSRIGVILVLLYVMFIILGFAVRLLFFSDERGTSIIPEGNGVVASAEGTSAQSTAASETATTNENILDLSVDKTYLAVLEGGTAGIAVNMSTTGAASAGDLLWSSSDETVATVDSAGHGKFLCRGGRLFFRLLLCRRLLGTGQDLTAFRTDHGTFGGFISTVFTFHCCSLLLAANCHCP